MEFYLATKENEILSFASTWMELEKIILSKVNQAQKAKRNAVILLDMGHMLKGEQKWEKWGKGRKPKT
jgi:hypothetical protein